MKYPHVWILGFGRRGGTWKPVNVYSTRARARSSRDDANTHERATYTHTLVQWTIRKYVSEVKP